MAGREVLRCRSGGREGEESLRLASFSVGRQQDGNVASGNLLLWREIPDKSENVLFKS